jgi:gliding motility-associated protein GldL
MITKQKSKNPLLRWIQNEDNMNFVYGFGAAIVILGALFKLQHWPFANEMLIVGLLTEAFIFAISAFDPPTVHELDWSKVYPQLAPGGKSGSPTANMDAMMKEAKIEPEILRSVGAGLKKLAAQTKNVNDLADASIATKDYTESIKGASESLKSVNTSYGTISSAAKDMAKSSNNLKEAVTLTNQYKNNLHSASESLKAIVSSASAITDSAKGMASTPAQAEKLSAELESLTNNLNKLNKVYGGMYDAMHK